MIFINCCLIYNKIRFNFAAWKKLITNDLVTNKGKRNITQPLFMTRNS